MDSVMITEKRNWFVLFWSNVETGKLVRMFVIMFSWTNKYTYDWFDLQKSLLITEYRICKEFGCQNGRRYFSHVYFRYESSQNVTILLEQRHY